MPDCIQDRISDALRQAESLYHRLVLLVGETGSGKTEALRTTAKGLGTNVINVNLELSAKLLELTARQRALRVFDLLDETIAGDASVALLDNTEILFSRDLQQDPLRLLEGMARTRCVVASWNGKITKNTLTYAEVGHSEYRSYELTEALVVEIDETTVNGAVG